MRSAWIVLLMVTLLISACASHRSKDELTESLYYQRAHKEVVKGHYNQAIDDMKELKARFPYSDYAEQAQLELIYSNYQAGNYADAVAEAHAYLNNYPTSKQIDYVLYIKGVSNYRLTESFFGRFFKRDNAARDLSDKRDAYNDFAELIRRFPDSKYAPDARSRMVYIRQLLAKHNLEVARYYARRQAFIASANRAQRIVEHFQGTPSVEEALAIMSRCYTALQQPQLAAKSRKVLVKNWPHSKFLNEDGKVSISWWPRKKTWLELLTFDLL